MKLIWRDHTQEHAGLLFGYSTHNRIMKEETGKLIELTDDAEDCLLITTADNFSRVEGKYNFLFSMFECNDLPETYIDRLSYADHIIVPCYHNKWLFEKYTMRPVHVCPEGVYSDIFTYKVRKVPRTGKHRFRFFWCGAPNNRKGLPTIFECWKMFEHNKDAELYLKFSVSEGFEERNEFSKIILDATEKPVRLEKYPNVILDARKLPLDKLVGLYHKAHAFVIPTVGEGWGLTAIEAMSTGLPVIAPIHTGHEMFMMKKTCNTCGTEIGIYADEDCECREVDVNAEMFVVPVKWDVKPLHVDYFGLDTSVFVPQTDSVAVQMLNVFNNYPAARELGIRAAEHVKENFQWHMAAEKLVKIIKENGYYGRK